MPQLDQDQFGAVHKALLDAFGSKESLEPLATRARNKRLDHLALGDSLEDIVAKIIRRADEEVWLPNLILAAHELRPNDEAIERLAEDFRPVAELLAADHFETQFLRPRSRFALINRRKLRAAVRSLHDDRGGGRVLVVDGDKVSGKTYSRYYIGYLQDVKRTFRFVWVDLTRLPKNANGAVRAAEVGRQIASQLGLQGMPVQGQEQDAAWVQYFCDWLTGALAPGGQQNWIVIDGFSSVMVDEGVKILADELAIRIDTNLPDLRLILLAYEDIRGQVPGAEYEWIEPIGDEELVEFFTALHRLHDARVAEEALTSRVMASVVRVLEAAPADAPRRLELLSGAVAAEAQCIISGSN